MQKLNLKRFSSYFTGVNLVAAIIIVNIIFSFFPYLKLDLTKDKVHTLSSATKSIISNLDDVVNIKVYMTQDLPSQVKPIASDLKSILMEFTRMNKGKFMVEYADPSKSDEVKLEAEKNGIQPLQFSSVKNDKLEVSNGYLGLKVSYGNKQEVLPVAGDVGNIEYFLVSSIKKLTSKQLPKVVLVEGGQTQTASSYSLFEHYLGNNYQVISRKVDDETDLPGDTSLLIMLNITQKLGDKPLAKVIEYLGQDKGMLYMSGKTEVNGAMQATKLADSGLENWLKEKGITMEPKIVADTSSAVASFRTGNSSFYTQYPYWLQIRSENINRNIPATSGLNSLLMPWSSPLFLAGNAQSLFTSSNQSIASENLNDLSPVSKVDLTHNAEKQTLAAINTESKLAVIGNSTFIQDQFVQNSQENLVLTLNLVDYLSNDQALMSIRSKILSSSPLMQVSDQMKQWVKIGNIATPLLILGIIAFVSNWMRKKNNRQWMQN